MSRRKGVVVSRERWTADQPSPHTQVAKVTVELRIFWPNNATDDDITATIATAVGAAMLEVWAARE